MISGARFYKNKFKFDVDNSYKKENQSSFCQNKNEYKIDFALFR